MRQRGLSGNFAVVLLVVFILSPACLEARGLFGGLGRALKKTFSGVKSEVTGTVSGIKGDVEQGTGIPISKIEMRKRLGGVRKVINGLHRMVKSVEEMDGAVVYFWEALGQMEEGDDATLQKVVEYLEGTLKYLRRTKVNKARFSRMVQVLINRLMNLSGHRAELGETFDFVAYFRLNPREGDEPAADEGQDPTGADDGSGYDDGTSAGEGGGDTGEDTGEEEDPVLAEYRSLKAKYARYLKGKGYLRINVRGVKGSTFSVVDPETGDVLADNAATNRNLRIKAGIYHLAVNVGDVTIYRLNVLIKARKIVQLQFVSFGKLKLADDVDEAFTVYEKKTMRPAFEGLSAGTAIVLPAGKYVLSNEDGSRQKEVAILKGKVVTVRL